MGIFKKFQRSNVYDAEEVEIIGAIINHPFIIADVFPLQLCNTTLNQQKELRNENNFHQVRTKKQ